MQSASTPARNPSKKPPPVFHWQSTHGEVKLSVAMQSTLQLPPDNLDFAWDRHETAASLKAKLADESSTTWHQTAAWLMREARVEQVWEFISLEQIHRNFPRISPLLGRQRPVWDHLLRAAHELGRL
ncbi:MAG: hypothetical protein AB8F34_16650 [Akkermansiaceae bacterium]